jgi:3-isopropylmalate/(R)-2-methylmalate dehydratase small subunit
MEKFNRLVGIAAPLREANIDTDQILPKQFLKVVERQGLARALFYDLRFDSAGNPQHGFVLTTPPYDKAKILIAGENFACGSSREHAVWALVDFGIRCVIAPSFGEIFFNNSFNNGLLPIVVPQRANDRLLEEARAAMPLFTIDLAAQIITSPSGLVVDFQLDPTRKRKLLLGLDEIGETLEHLADIEAFEATLRGAGKALMRLDE